MLSVKRGCLILTLLAAAGCRNGDLPPGVFSNPLKSPAAHNEAMCTLRIVTISRPQVYLFERMWKFLDAGAFLGSTPAVMAMNGLKLARVDMRFRRQFDEILEQMRKNQDTPEYFRLYEGLEQTFGIGPVFDENTLIVWSNANSVIGRHFRKVRYRMKLQVEVLREGLADFRVNWQARTGAGLSKTVSISPAAATVTLETRQSLVVAPADFSGRGLGRPFLSGIGDADDEITFLILTPNVIRKKAEPTASR